MELKQEIEGLKKELMSDENMGNHWEQFQRV